MADIISSGRRILAAYGVGEAERIPMRDIDRENPGGWRADPEFRRLARLVQEYCDPLAPYNHVDYPTVFTSFSYQRFLEAPDTLVEKLPIEQVGPRRTRTTYVLRSPKGDLFWSFVREEDIDMSWDTRKPISSPHDVEAMLSVPFSFDKPSDSRYEAFRQHRREVGRNCIGGGWLTSMVAMLVGIMNFELVLEWVLQEPGLIRMLADAWLERTWAKLDFLLSRGVGPFWHINGVERASPPMMGPRQWDEWVVPYDGEIIRRIKNRDPEARIHVHCHGRISSLLDSWIAMGVDSIDPVEPPPQGDIQFVEAKRRVKGRITLFGSIESCWLDMARPDEIELAVRSAIEDGGSLRMALMPSATRYERHTERYNANALRYIEAGLRYGGL